MARYPKALWKPLRENVTQGKITPRAIILHTAVSDALSLFNFFQNNSDLESHFYVREDGTVEQYMDTGVRADANKNANDFAVSIETWDGRTIRPWTTRQVDSLVNLCDWLCRTHGIPRVQIPTANGAGIGWHVMFGAPGPWTPVSKSCPGVHRIEQTKKLIIPSVAARANWTPPRSDDEMTPAQMAELKTYIDAKMREGVRYLDHNDPTAKGVWAPQNVILDELRKLRAEVAAYRAERNQT